MPDSALFENESVESMAVPKGMVPKAPTVISMPDTALFENESLDQGAAADFDDTASIVNSIISGEDHIEPYCGTMEYKGVELPVTQTDVNLASLVNDKDLWEMSSMESESIGASFDITDADIEQFDWELSSTEM